MRKNDFINVVCGGPVIVIGKDICVGVVTDKNRERERNYTVDKTYYTASTNGGRRKSVWVASFLRKNDKNCKQ